MSDKDLHIVLYEPEIPYNAGSVGRTCVAVAAKLWPGDEASFQRVLTAVKWLDDQLYERLRGWVKRAWNRIVGGGRETAANVR